MKDRADWQIELSQCITDMASLIEFLDLPADWVKKNTLAQSVFQLKVPRPYLNRINKQDPNDPLLLQILPLSQELIDTKGYTQDPLAEKQYNPIPGVLHKYTSRILVTTAGACSINCRYCFRRHFPYENNAVNTDHWDHIKKYLHQHPHVNEVILSGGDPLLLKDSQILNIYQSISQVPSIKRIRIHTRLPIAIPQRITDKLVAAVTSCDVKPIIVIHCNHPQEIDNDVAQALNLLYQAGICVLNQTVLLKGINDHSQTLVGLSEKLFECNVMPYYLHALDKVQNTSHFDIPISQAQSIHGQLKAILPGFLVPKLVKEDPHQSNKTWV